MGSPSEPRHCRQQTSGIAHPGSEAISTQKPNGLHRPSSSCDKLVLHAEELSLVRAEHLPQHELCMHIGHMEEANALLRSEAAEARRGVAIVEEEAQATA